MKKLLLIIALTIFGLGLNAQNVGDVITIANLEFKITSFFPFECEVSDYSGNQGFISIPSTVEISGTEYSVTSIGDWVFYECSSLTSIEIPNSVTSIGTAAFQDCLSLTSIEIPNSVTSIRQQTFYGCSSLASVTFGENSQLTSIGRIAFGDCSSLTSIEIPSSVTSIGNDAFSGCSSLTSIEIPNSVTSIGNSAFEDCSSLTSIDIPDSLTEIGARAFYGCSSLTSIDIPDSVTEIWGNTFSGCSGLTSIEIPNSVTDIGSRAFSGCSSLTSIEIPNSVTSIGYSVFSGCLNLTSMVVEEGNPVYDSRDNSNAIIETATNTLISGYEYTIIPNSVTSIGNSAFSGCSSLTSIEIPNPVTSIGSNAFSSCTNLIVVFEENSQLTSIEFAAFSGCSNLTSIEIPNSVTYIGDYAFCECSSLRVIKCYADNVPEIECNQDFCMVFYECPSDMTIYVPINSVQEYKAADPWNDYNIVGSCKVSVSANNKDYGTVEGGGLYGEGENVTVKAIANQYCYFINWTENDNVVSTNAEYTFYAVNPDRNLVANFVKISVPENIEATALSASSVSLSWDAVEDADSYNVYRDGELLKNVNTNSYLDEGLEAYTEYCYKITAVRNEIETDKSLEVCATTFDLPITTPENLEANALSASSIILTWNVVENAESYNVYRDGNSIANVANPTYTDKDLEYNTKYCYEVAAVRGDEESEKSKMVCAKTLGESIEELSSSINIYPNPVDNELFLATEVRVKEVSIYDIYGRQTMRQQVNETTSQQVVEVAELEAGVYFMKVVTNEGEIVKRFVKK